MEILLFFLLLLMLVFTILVVKTLIHPLVILKSICTFSAFILIFYSKIWQVSISLDTVIIFILGLLFVDYGYLFMFYIFNKKRKIPAISPMQSNEMKEKEYSTKIALLFFLYILGLIIVVISKGQLNINNGIDDLSESIMTLKVDRRDGNVEGLGVWQYPITFATAVGLTYTLVSLKEWFNKGISKNLIIFLLPVISTLLLTYLMGRRSFLLIVIIVSLILSYEFIVKKNNGITLKQQVRYLFASVTLLTLFYFFFVSVGALFNKNLHGGAFNVFAIYLSGGIVAFDYVYKDYILTSELFGQNLFRIVYVVLNLLPGANFNTDTITQTIYLSKEFATNVYTVNLHYMADFGLIGVIIGNVMIGIILGFVYNKSKREREIGFWHILSAFFMFKLLSYTGAEKYFVSMTINIQQVFIFLLLLKTPLLYKKANLNKSNKNKSNEPIY
ncbi:O-antigen polymerase [Alkalihalobacterium elongatum]|uniref:O-antigen polymerase n=1 Tax=Alkalihalobacterium elongatum TaxID=2675466 RepID=UPI001C1FF68E|nr:O-antigen polymerase [Alkalihalobacterium elongatum]